MRLRKVLVSSFVVLLVFVLAVSTAAGETVEQRRFAEAMSELSRGNYASAAEKFASLDAFEQASYWAMYSRAMEETQKGNYQTAYDIFTFLGAFQDSALRLHYVRAESYEAAERYESARDIYQEYSFYLDFKERLAAIPEKINARDYRYAERLEARGSLPDAYDAFRKLGSYRDSADRAQKVTAKMFAAYAEAEQLEAEDKLDQAYAAFLALVPYRDAQDRADAVMDKIHALRYAEADQLEAEGKYQEAWDIFQELIPYSDSSKRADAIQEKLKEIRYQAACALEREGRLEDAYKAFEELIPYSDSKACAQRVLEALNDQKYEKAEKLENDGQLSAAYNLFFSIRGHRDSADRAAAVEEKLAALYQKAQQLETDGKPGEAYEAFKALIPYKDSRECADRLLQDLKDKYQEAEKLAEQEKHAEAQQLFYSLIPYSDSSERAEALMPYVHEMYYQSARTFEDQENYIEAVKLYAMLGTYEDSAERLAALKEPADYQMAGQYLTQSRWAEARDLYESLGDYLDSREKAYALGVTRFAEEVTALSADVLAYRFHGVWGIVNTRTNAIQAARWKNCARVDHGTILVEEDGRKGLLNEDGNILLPPVYTSISAFDSNGTAKITKMEGRTGLINEQAEILLEVRYSSIGDFDRNGLAQIVFNGKTGLADTSGHIVLEPGYDAIGAFDRIGLAQVTLNGKVGLTDTQGRIVAEPVYDSIGEYSMDGLALAQRKSLWGYLDTDGTEVIACRWQQISDVRDGLCIVRQGNASSNADCLGIVDREDRVILEPEWAKIDSARWTEDGWTLSPPAFVGVFVRAEEKNGQQALILKDGTMLSGRTWSEIGQTAEDAIAVQENQKWGFIRTDGSILCAPAYDSVKPFREGMAAVCRHGLWGYIDASGREMIEPQYRQAGQYKNGKADVLVQVEGWNIIDTDGRIMYVTNKTFEAAENLLSEGRWEEAALQFESMEGSISAEMRAHVARYMLAGEQFSSGEYEQAAENYALSETYRDSEAMVLKSGYLQAETLLASGERRAAAEWFHRAIGFEDAADREKQIYYEDAVAAGEAGNLEEALQLFEKCISYQDSQTRREALLVARGEQLTEAGNWTEAAYMYARLSDPEERGDRLKTVNDRHVEALMADGKFEEALVLLGTADIHGDRETQILRAQYLYAEHLLASGDRAGAAAWFHDSVPYEDAADREYQIYYEDAAAAFEAGEYHTAIQSYDRCIGYLDSFMKREAVIAAMGEALMSAGAWTDAAEAFEMLSDADEKAEWIKTLNDRHIASLADNGQFDEALLVLEGADIHGDRVEQRKTLMYRKANALLDAGNYAEALENYQKVLDTADAMQIIRTRDELKEELVRWQQAVQAGETIRFGHREDGTALAWRVLKRQDHSLFLISEEILGTKPFMEKKATRTTWQHSTLRTWLNEAFLTEFFTEEERSAIAKTGVKAEKSSGSKVSPGNNTEDYVYLLSEREFSEYLSELGKKSVSGEWWLRSPGKENNEILCSDISSQTLNACSSGEERGIRPVMWIDDSMVFGYAETAETEAEQPQAEAGDGSQESGKAGQDEMKSDEASAAFGSLMGIEYLRIGKEEVSAGKWPCQGLLVIKVNNGGAAQKAGIQEGDILIGGGGIKLTSGDKAVRTLTERIQSGSTVKFRVRRAKSFSGQAADEYAGDYQALSVLVPVTFQ